MLELKAWPKLNLMDQMQPNSKHNKACNTDLSRLQASATNKVLT